MWKTIGQNYDGPALLGVRFLLAALTVGSSLGLIARFKRHFIAVERSHRSLLVLTGVTFITGGFEPKKKRREKGRLWRFSAPCSGSIEFYLLGKPTEPTPSCDG